MSTPTLHVASLPHLATNRENSACAFTVRALRFCQMMRDTGWNVIHYGLEGSDVPCEHVQVMSVADRDKHYGVLPREAAIPPDFFNPAGRFSKLWRIHTLRTATAITERANKGDFFCTIAGDCQRPLSEAIGALPAVKDGKPIPTELLTVEFGIGYTGSFSLCRVFDSYSLQAETAGRYGTAGNMNFFDAVIPNAYEITDFPAGNGGGIPENMHNYFGVPAGRDGSPYLLYIGRLTKVKGIEIAVAVSKAVGMPLLVAGQGVTEKHPTKIITAEFTIDEPHVKYIGVLGPDERAKVMGAAHAVMVPSLYNEPLGGVNIESQICSTPVITTDWGGFAETVEHGLTGYRCRNIREFVAAVRACGSLDREYIRARAIRLWSTGRVKWMYDAYFKRLAGGVGAESLNRTDLPADLMALNQSRDWNAEPVQRPSNGNGKRLLVQT